MPPAITAQRTYAMLDNETLWQVAVRTHAVLSQRGIDHAVAGGVAVCLHGYRRNTVDLDLLIRPEDAEAFRWDAGQKEFHSPSGVTVQVLLAGEAEGPGQQATFPDPRDDKVVTRIEGLPVLSLAQLIQSKIACGLGNLRRTHKDFADVVELIAIHRLDGAFARHLHKSVRKEYRELVRHAT